MKKLITAIAMIFPFILFSQKAVNLNDIQPGRFDQGKMWTFENPPVEYFQEAYGFTPSKEWMEDVHKSALRFASWCSASFISSSGLIMTNHHCSRSVVASVMREGESFDDNGFYAQTLTDERRVPNLFVDQLVMIADITQEVKSKSNIAPDSALKVIQAEYAQKPEWANLRMETRTFYSGGKYSLYGFKRYNDIRLVLYPEMALGYFGGDPDNFTFPRYALDFTFFRAYDETGNPLAPANYFSFKPAGATENEPIFVVGNPGSTGRYLTMSQLYYQRDVLVPTLLTYFDNRFNILMTAAEGISDVYKKDSVTNLAFGISNSQKAYTGRLDGYYDPVLMTKKEKKEAEVRANVKIEGNDPWNELENNMKLSANYFSDMFLLSPNPVKGKVNMLIQRLPDYLEALEKGDSEALEKSKKSLEAILKDFDKNLERTLFTALLMELQTYSKGNFIAGLLKGKSPADVATSVIANSVLINDTDKFFKLKAGKTEKEPLINFANAMVPRYKQTQQEMQRINAENGKIQARISNLQFELSGASSPPDATFSLRLADGVVKGYEYNGTVAPYFTTYFGLYDRHFSHGTKYPWNLPARWMNPPMDLLKSPMNFVSTADIIGGNSGSPVINQNQEVVGLVFDGNIESLPGYFIFDDSKNRTVSVHAGGIAAAVKYIYKAERLLKELNYE